MSAVSYRSSDLARILGARLVGDGQRSISQLAIDSRKPLTSSETLFVALPGENHDGARFIPELIERGVDVFMVRDIPAKDLHEKADFLVVPDPLKALQELAGAHRASFTLPVIGITGSNGKTIVKEWLFQLLREEEHIVRSPGSWNSQVGVPLSVWGIRKAHTLGIFEAGISRRGEMQRLAEIIAPSIGVLTTIGPAHGEGFTDDAEKTHEKCLLFGNAQAVICCTDQPVVRDAMDRLAPALLRDWSRTQKAFLQVVNETLDSAFVNVTLRVAGKDHAFTLPFTDKASIDNALTCITVLFHLGRSAEWIDTRLALLEPVEMRLRTMQGVHGSTLIDDSYSNDLASLSIALDHQARIAHGRKRVVVLGDIAESALDADRLYADVTSQLERAKVDRLIGVGPGICAHAQLLPPGTRTYADTTALLKSEDPALLAGSVVLVKGARELRLERVVQRWQQQVHGTELEVDLEAIRHNLNHFRAQLAPNVKVMAMVKAFGYGSGAIELARLFAHEGVHYLGVAYADEGIELRQHGIKTPILVMNPEPVPHETLHRFDLEAEVYDLGSLQAAIEFARTTDEAQRVHLKLDTGMHRLGFMPDELPALLIALQGAPITITSFLSHLAASDDPIHDAFTREQIALFTAMADRIDAVLGYRPLRHIANSGAIGRFPEAHLDMVRLGIGLHGIGANAAESRSLIPSATLRTVIAQVKRIPAGDTVGYGRQGTVPADMRLAILPIGYADGLPRRAGNGVGRVWIHGEEARTVGNICMDMCMVDVTRIPCAAGDEVILFGRTRSLAQYASDIGTIPYEALTAIAPRVRRVYTAG